MRTLRTTLFVLVFLLLGSFVSAQESSPQHENWVDSTARVINSATSSSGAGCLVRYPDVIVTNYHVVKDSGGEVEVQFSDGEQYQGTVINFDKDWDLALIELDTNPGRTAFAIGDSFDEGTDVWLARYSVKSEPVTVPTKISISEQNLFMLESKADYGDSGSCIINRQGEIIGVIVFRLSLQGYGNGVGVGTKPLKSLWDEATSPDIPSSVSRSEMPERPRSGHTTPEPETDSYDSSANEGRGSGVGQYEIGDRMSRFASAPDCVDSVVPRAEFCLVDDEITIEQNGVSLDFTTVGLYGRRGKIEQISLMTPGETEMSRYSLDEIGEWSRSFWLEFINRKDGLIEEDHAFVTYDRYNADVDSSFLFKGVGQAKTSDGIHYSVVWIDYEVMIQVSDQDFYELYQEFSGNTEKFSDDPSASDLMK